jgi:hypothetical protein
MTTTAETTAMATATESVVTTTTTTATLVMTMAMTTAAAATVKVAGIDNNQLKSAAEGMAAAMVTVMATAGGR